MSEYAGSLPKNPINLDSTTQYLNASNDQEGGATSERLPVTPPEFYLDPDFESFSPHLQYLQLNPTSLAEGNEASNAFREHIHKNRPQVNERSIRQDRNFEVGKSVGVAVLALDRASTDDNRIFGQAKQAHNRPSYKTQTKYRVLDRNFPTSELMPLLSTIDLKIPVPTPYGKGILNAVAARDSMYNQ